MASELSPLSNGWRLATTTLPHARSVSIGFYLQVGSRHEQLAECGAAHFLEHMLFKGTEKRDAKAIVWDVESHGGSINAFTTDDHTCYDASGPSEILPILADVLADIVWHSTLPEHEIERERQVILEEIIMYQENPSEHVDDLSCRVLWAPHPLGRPITGTPESLEQIGRAELMDFYHRHYHHGSHIISVAGPQSHEEIRSIIEPLLVENHGPPQNPSPRFDRHLISQPKDEIETRDIEQTHLNISWHCGGHTEPNRRARQVLSTLMGETMSSRLFQSLREQSGLCYHIETSTESYHDTGSFSISAGLDSQRLPEALVMLRDEIDKILATPPSEEEVSQAKRYMIGQSQISFETTGAWMGWCADNLLVHGELRDPKSIRQEWELVSAADVHTAARELFQSPRALAAITALPDVLLF